MYTLRQKLVLATVVVFSIATLSILAATRWIVMDAVAMETTRACARSASLLSAAVTPLRVRSDMASLDELTQSLVRSGDVRARAGPTTSPLPTQATSRSPVAWSNQLAWLAETAKPTRSPGRTGVMGAARTVTLPAAVLTTT